MPNLSNLDALRDIHLPAAISWWPLASGWYLLIALTILILIFSLNLAYKRYASAIPKKEALRLLLTYQQLYKDKKAESAYLAAKISELLKRVALVYYPRSLVAKLSGDDWLSFLNSTSKNLNFSQHREYFLALAYQGQDLNLDLAPIFDLAKNWIQQRGTPCLV